MGWDHLDWDPPSLLEQPTGEECWAVFQGEEWCFSHFAVLPAIILQAGLRNGDLSHLLEPALCQAGFRKQIQAMPLLLYFWFSSIWSSWYCLALRQDSHSTLCFLCCCFPSLRFPPIPPSLGWGPSLILSAPDSLLPQVWKELMAELLNGKEGRGLVNNSERERLVFGPSAFGGEKPAILELQPGSL